MNTEVSSLLKPLCERDRLISEAQNAIEQENYEHAITLFDKISDICIELGDNSLAIEFKEKSENLKKALSL